MCALHIIHICVTRVCSYTQFICVWHTWRHTHIHTQAHAREREREGDTEREISEPNLMLATVKCFYVDQF